MNEELTIAPLHAGQALPKYNSIVPVDNSPSGLLRLAVERNLDIDKLQKFMELHREWEVNEARKAYYLAVSEFKRNPPTVTKDKKNTQYDSWYTSIGNLTSTVNTELGKHGLSANWSYDQGEKTISATCILTHAMGHHESVTLSAPPDVSGSKNPIQQIKSTTTYLRIATFEAVTGVASNEHNVNDDGNGSGKPPEPVITEKQAADLHTMMEDFINNKKSFLAWLKVESLSELPVRKYQMALDKCEAARKRRGAK